MTRHKNQVRDPFRCVYCRKPMETEVEVQRTVCNSCGGYVNCPVCDKLHDECAVFATTDPICCDCRDKAELVSINL